MTIMIRHSHIKEQVEDIIASIPLQTKQFQGWQTLYDLYITSGDYHHPRIAELVRKGTTLAYEALMVSRNLLVLDPLPLPLAQFVMVQHFMQLRHQLKKCAHKLRRVILADTAPGLNTLPSELADSDVVHFWIKRYRIKLVECRKEEE